MRAQVYGFIVGRGDRGATDAEIRSSIKGNVSGCRRELYRDGLIDESGWTRPTARGRPAKVWVARGIGCGCLLP